MFEIREIYRASKKRLRIVTLAPELTGALDAISWLNERDILVAGGHSNATFGEAINGIMVGMRHATHLFNGMRILHHREPGIVGATLYDDRVTVELIADNFHIHPAIIKFVVKIKSVSKTSLVSDSIVGAGLPDGKYEFGGMKIIVKQGKSFLKSGILAGSTIRLCDAVKNMVQKYGFCLQNAVEMASSTPAKIIGLHRKGYLAPGMDADITVLDQNLSTVLTMVQGKIVYRRMLYEHN
jgi:N-acetylglucosamine-6-phosphate deacetylase